MSAVTRKRAKKRGKNVKPVISSGSKKTKAPGQKNTRAPRKKLIQELDRLCSQITRINWRRKCATCGKAGTQAHHYFGKKACSSLRWTEDNLVWLCFYCHIVRIHREGLVEPARYALINKIGIDRFNGLYLEAFKPQKKSVPDLLELKERLSTRLESLLPK
jgi:hypothetical protein